MCVMTGPPWVTGAGFFVWGCSLSRGLHRPAAFALEARHQAAVFDIEGLGADHLPLMKATLAQCLALVFLTQAGFLEFEDVAHVPIVAWVERSD